jgi:hypothetical protein
MADICRAVLFSLLEEIVVFDERGDVTRRVHNQTQPSASDIHPNIHYTTCRLPGPQQAGHTVERRVSVAEERRLRHPVRSIVPHTAIVMLLLRSRLRLGWAPREDANTRACMSIVDMPMCDGGIDRHGTARCHVLWVNENSANYCVLVAGFILYPTIPQFLSELGGH